MSHLGPIGLDDRFDRLPRRIFIDTSTLQTLQDYGEFIWENVPPAATDRIYRVPDGFQEIDALRAIFFVNQRAMFEFVLSKHSVVEVVDRAHPGFLQWAFDVLDHWEACLSGYKMDGFSGTGRLLAPKLDGLAFGYLSAKDRLLLRDAVELECDAFLTMERKLPKNAPHFQREVGLQILRPSQYWELLRPWAALYT